MDFVSDISRVMRVGASIMRDATVTDYIARITVKRLPLLRKHPLHSVAGDIDKVAMRHHNHPGVRLLSMEGSLEVTEAPVDIRHTLATVKAYIPWRQLMELTRQRKLRALLGSRNDTIDAPASLYKAVVDCPLTHLQPADIRSRFARAQKWRNVSSIERAYATLVLIDPFFSYSCLLDAFC